MRKKLITFILVLVIPIITLPLSFSYAFEYKNIACGNSGQTYSIRFPDASEIGNRPNIVELIDGRKCIGNLVLDKTVNEINANAFNSSLLESVTIPDSVTKIGAGAFADIKTLKTVTFGKSIKEIASQAFYGDSGLESILLPASLKTIGYGAFKNTSSLKVIKIVESLTQSEGINHEAEFLAGSAVQSYTIPYGSFNRFNSQSFWASSVNEIIFCDKLQDGSTSNFSLPVAVSCPPFRVLELEKLKGQDEESGEIPKGKGYGFNKSNGFKSKERPSHGGIDYHGRQGDKIVIKKAGEVVSVNTGCSVGNQKCGGGSSRYPSLSLASSTALSLSLFDSKQQQWW
jgi:hypothetical protein